MEKTALTFLFIKEERESSSRAKIMILMSCLEEIGNEGRAPQADETYETLLTNKTYSPKAIIVNLNHPDLRKIMQLKEQYHKKVPVIFMYQPGSLDKLREEKNRYEVKYDIPRNQVNTNLLNNLYLKINTDTNFQEKQDGKRYQFLQNLGKGASSVVDLYYDKQEDRKVAIKKIQVEGLKEIEKSKIEKEVDLMKSIDIPTAIKLYAFEYEGDNRYIYMEYANERTLDEKIYKMKVEGKEFTTEEIFDYLIEILLALYALKKKQIVHRDIKTENILLTKEKFKDKEKIIVKLSDLGVSRKLDNVVGSMTRCGTVKLLNYFKL